MTLKLLLLVLALTASQIAQVHCDENSGDAETEEIKSEEIIVPTLEAESVESQSQVALNITTPAVRLRVSSTKNPNGTQKHSFIRLGLPAENITSTVPSTTEGEERNDDSDDIFTVIVVSLVLTLVLTAVVVLAGILINRKRRREKEAALREDPYLNAEGGEKVPMPMFEDDVPSVMELEMEDLEKWMIKGDGGISTDSKHIS